MNFVAHYYLDKQSTDSLFFIGLATPDLVSAYDRSIRLKEGNLPILIENKASEAQFSFFHGVMRHFEGDRIFHSSPFFDTQTKKLTHQLKEAFGERDAPRAFFAAHILLELILDRILIMEHNDLLYRFYSHFEKKEVSELAELSRWICKHSMPGYEDFLQKFSARKFLYRYSEWDYLIKVTAMILDKVGIHRYGYLLSDTFLELIQNYEKALAKELPGALRDLFAQFGEKVITSPE